MGDLRFLYTALLEHPAFIRGEKNKTIFEEMFNRRLEKKLSGAVYYNN